MTSDDKLEIRVTLEERLQFLESRELSIQAGSCPDDNEYASMVSEMHLHMVLRERESHLVAEVREALARLKDPDYGLCAECGEYIGLPRLKANPLAVFCIACQESEERAA